MLSLAYNVSLLIELLSNVGWALLCRHQQMASQRQQVLDQAHMPRKGGSAVKDFFLSRERLSFYFI